MGRIVHLALKVDEVEKTGEFYKKVFGFQDAETTKTRDHISRHMTDGKIDFTLLQYEAGTQSAESKAAGDGPCGVSCRPLVPHSILTSLLPGPRRTCRCESGRCMARTK